MRTLLSPYAFAFALLVVGCSGDATGAREVPASVDPLTFAGVWHLTGHRNHRFDCGNNGVCLIYESPRAYDRAVRRASGTLLVSGPATTVSRSENTNPREYVYSMPAQLTVLDSLWYQDFQTDQLYFRRARTTSAAVSLSVYFAVAPGSNAVSYRAGFELRPVPGSGDTLIVLGEGSGSPPRSLGWVNYAATDTTLWNLRKAQ